MHQCAPVQADAPVTSGNNNRLCEQQSSADDCRSSEGVMEPSVCDKTKKCKIKHLYCKFKQCRQQKKRPCCAAGLPELSTHPVSTFGYSFCCRICQLNSEEWMIQRLGLSQGTDLFCLFVCFLLSIIYKIRQDIL